MIIVFLYLCDDKYFNFRPLMQKKKKERKKENEGLSANLLFLQTSQIHFSSFPLHLFPTPGHCWHLAVSRSMLLLLLSRFSHVRLCVTP